MAVINNVYKIEMVVEDEIQENTTTDVLDAIKERLTTDGFIVHEISVKTHQL